MKRNIIIIFISVFILWAWSSAERSELPTDSRGVKLQTCAPLSKNDTALTGNKQTVDVTDANCWGVYVDGATKVRFGTTGMMHTIPAGSWHVEAIANPDKVADYTQLQFSSAGGGSGTFRSDKP